MCVNDPNCIHMQRGGTYRLGPHGNLIRNYKRQWRTKKERRAWGEQIAVEVRKTLKRGRSD